MILLFGWVEICGDRSTYTRTVQYLYFYFADLVYCREDWTIYKGPRFLVSWGRMIRLHAQPPPPSLPSVNRTGDTQEDWVREAICWLERGGTRSQIIRSQDSMVFYDSFNTLWWNISDGKTTHLPGNLRRLTQIWEEGSKTDPDLYKYLHRYISVGTGRQNIIKILFW